MLSNCIDINIKFSQSVYNAAENYGYAEPVLVISGPLSTNITVIVRSLDKSANGELDQLLSYYNFNNLFVLSLCFPSISSAKQLKQFAKVFTGTHNSNTDLEYMHQISYLLKSITLYYSILLILCKSL